MKNDMAPIFEKGEDRNLKFGVGLGLPIDLGKSHSHLTDDKIQQKGRGQGLLNPFRKFGTGETRNFKFGIHG